MRVPRDFLLASVVLWSHQSAVGAFSPWKAQELKILRSCCSPKSSPSSLRASPDSESKNALLQALLSSTDAAGSNSVGSSLLTNAPLLLVPLAGLIAGRQALQKREIAKMEIEQAKAQVVQKEKEYLEANRSAKTSVATATLSTALSLAVLLGAVDLSSIQDGASTFLTFPTSLAQAEETITEKAVTAVAATSVPASGIPETISPKKAMETDKAAIDTRKAGVPSTIALSGRDDSLSSSIYDSLLAKLSTGSKQAETKTSVAAPDTATDGGAQSVDKTTELAQDASSIPIENRNPSNSPHLDTLAAKIVSPDFRQDTKTSEPSLVAVAEAEAASEEESGSSSRISPSVAASVAEVSKQAADDVLLLGTEERVAVSNEKTESSSQSASPITASLAEVRKEQGRDDITVKQTGIMSFLDTLVSKIAEPAGFGEEEEEPSSPMAPTVAAAVGQVGKEDEQDMDLLKEGRADAGSASFVKRDTSPDEFADVDTDSSSDVTPLAPESSQAVAAIDPARRDNPVITFEEALVSKVADTSATTPNVDNHEALVDEGKGTGVSSQEAAATLDARDDILALEGGTRGFEKELATASSSSSSEPEVNLAKSLRQDEAVTTTVETIQSASLESTTPPEMASTAASAPSKAQNFMETLMAKIASHPEIPANSASSAIDLSSAVSKTEPISTSDTIDTSSAAFTKNDNVAFFVKSVIEKIANHPETSNPQKVDLPTISQGSDPVVASENVDGGSPSRVPPSSTASSAEPSNVVLEDNGEKPRVVAESVESGSPIQSRSSIEFAKNPDTSFAEQGVSDSAFTRQEIDKVGPAAEVTNMFREAQDVMGKFFAHGFDQLKESTDKVVGAVKSNEQKEDKLDLASGSEQSTSTGSSSTTTASVEKPQRMRSFVVAGYTFAKHLAESAAAPETNTWDI